MQKMNVKDAIIDADLQIACASVQTSLGWMMVAATARGICMIAFGASPQMLQKQLRRRFSQATLVDGNATFRKWLAQATKAAENTKIAARLPLDIRGTSFQVQVWQALRQIPLGQTTTYSAIAKQIGNPRAVRAVATACAKNPTAVAVPCHRVVGKNGDLCGYRWGINRKKKLLTQEGALPNRKT